MEAEAPASVPYYLHEQTVARFERTNKRLWILIIILIGIIVVSNFCWIKYENSFEDVLTVTQETPGGNNNYIGTKGTIINGTADDN